MAGQLDHSGTNMMKGKMDSTSRAVKRLQASLKAHRVRHRIEAICAQSDVSLALVFAWSSSPKATIARRAVIRLLLDNGIAIEKIADWFGAEVVELEAIL